jgi:hypothetical protein
MRRHVFYAIRAIDKANAGHTVPTIADLDPIGRKIVLFDAEIVLHREGEKDLHACKTLRYERDQSPPTNTGPSTVSGPNPTREF